ncbi:MAG: SWIM zinc finger family protein, partial [Nitrosopumilaceae archaeon]
MGKTKEMQTLTQTRRDRGLAIAEIEDSIIRAHEYLYFVRSQSEADKRYSCELTVEQGWTCSCPDFVYRKQKCKHLWAVEVSLALRRNVESELAKSPKVIQPIN